jgi:hypothetical protein
MTAKGKITTSDISRRPYGTVRVLITDDQHGRKPPAGTTGPWFPAFNRRGMLAATVTKVETSGGSRRIGYYLTTDHGMISDVRGHQTFHLAPDDTTDPECSVAARRPAPVAVPDTSGSTAERGRADGAVWVTAHTNDEVRQAIAAPEATGCGGDGSPCNAAVAVPEPAKFEYQTSEDGGQTWRTVGVGMDAADIDHIRGRDAASEGRHWRAIPDTDDVLARQIAAKEAELVAATAAMTANFDRPAGTSRMRGKLHTVRVNAAISRGARLGNQVRRLEGELEGLRRRVGRPEPKPLDLARLPFARLIRTKVGWYEVVKVNAKSVKVKVSPGWDDRIPISRIVEIRERQDAPTTSAAVPDAGEGRADRPTLAAAEPAAPFVSSWAMVVSSQ